MLQSEVVYNLKMFENCSCSVIKNKPFDLKFCTGISMGKINTYIKFQSDASTGSGI